MTDRSGSRRGARGRRPATAVRGHVHRRDRYVAAQVEGDRHDVARAVIHARSATAATSPTIVASSGGSSAGLR